MPNWIKNKILVGNSNFGRRLVDKYCTYDLEKDIVEFDFNKVIKMPDSLQIEFSSKSDSALSMFLAYINPDISYYGEEDKKVSKEDYLKIVSKLKFKTMISDLNNISEERISELKDRFDEKEMLKLGKRQVENVLKYDALNWYDWSVKNWGTKWNAASFEASPDNKTFTFETAWDPAMEVMIEISRQNPDVKFAFLYSDEAIGSHVGYMLIKGGNIDFQGTFKDYSADAYKLAFDLWGCESDYEYSEKLNTYVYKKELENSLEMY